MHPETAAALAQINRDFYSGQAAEFSATRERPWPAWERVARLAEERLAGERAAGERVARERVAGERVAEKRVAEERASGERVAEKRAAGAPLSMLDLGCGNGRLGRFLESRWGDRLDYLGIDGSREILEIARAMGGRGRFARCDLLRDELPAGPFDLIAAFGLMHHLPGLANRAALLQAAARRLASGGLLAVSFWQFGAFERFRRRMVPWQVYNRTASSPIDPRGLEEGDVLLAWGQAPPSRGGTPAVRYCHWADPAEADRLLAGLPLAPVAGFRADGKAGDLNLYRLLQRG